MSIRRIPENMIEQTFVNKVNDHTTEIENLTNVIESITDIEGISAGVVKTGSLIAPVATFYNFNSPGEFTTIQGSLVESKGRFTRTWGGDTTTSDVYLRFENGYLRARNATVNRSLYFSDFGISTQVDGMPASGTLEFFSRVNSASGNGVTLMSGGVTTIKSNGGSVYLEATNDIVCNKSVYSPGFVTTSTNFYIGADGELRVVNKGVADTTTIGENVYYRDVRANVYRGTALDLDSTTSNQHIYVRPAPNGSLRVTSRGTTNSFRPVEASDFNTTSSIYLKKNVENYTDSAVSLINGTPVRKYHLLDDVDEVDPKRIGLVVQEAPFELVNINGGESINLYAMTSLLWKAVQELSAEIENLKGE